MSEPVLELEALEKRYHAGKPNELRVLGGASAQIAAGEVVALVAPSGAGKSTLLHIAGLLDRADAGTVRVKGRDLTRAAERERTEARRDQIGFVYQFHHLLPEFSALENIVLPQLAAGVSARQMQRRGRCHLLETRMAIERAGFANRPGRDVGRRAAARVRFCRALANAPALTVGR